MAESENVEVENKPGGWARNLKIIIGTIGYMVPLFWLWRQTGYPDAFGVHIAARGKGGLLEHWWYTYLLIERAQPWDILLFIWMWAPFAGLVGWVIWSQFNKIKGKSFKFSLFDDDPPPP